MQPEEAQFLAEGPTRLGVALELGPELRCSAHDN